MVAPPPPVCARRCSVDSERRTKHVGSNGDGKVRVSTQNLQRVCVRRLLETLVVHVQYLRTDVHSIQGQGHVTFTGQKYLPKFYNKKGYERWTGDGLTPSLTVMLANAKFLSFYCKTWYSEYSKLLPPLTFGQL